MSMSDDGGQLRDAIHEKTDPIFMKSKGEIWEYFLDRAGGDKKKAASTAARELSGESSGLAYRSARRNFEGGRENARGETPKWQDAGKNLPETGRNPKGGELTITVKGDQLNGVGKGTRARSFTKTFTGSDAYGFANNPSYRAFFRALGYPNEVIDKFEDGDYELTVSSVA